MKKFFILFAAASLLACSDTKNSNDTKDPEKPETKKPKELVEKPKEEQKKDLKDLFDPKKAEEVKSEDKRGWPEDRKSEVMQFCMQDMQGVPEGEAKSFCSCQLDNLMNAFSSYEEAMKLFNSMDEDEEGEVSDEQMSKAEKVMNANESCMEALMKKYNQGYDEEERDDAEESSRKKKNP